MQHLIGKELGPYRITAYIASGGMALVYQGVHTSLGRQVAIKVLLPHLADNEQFVERFNREAMNAAKVQHPNLLHVYDVGRIDNLHYMVMDYASGGTLEELLQQRRLTFHEITTIVAQLADGLAAAHAQGIIHRDLKPSNVLFSSDGVPMLADFGIALAIAATRLTGTGTSLGTPQYMSPEQARGGVVDHRSDIYSLGVMLYQLLTGKLPFDGETLAAIINKQLNEVPPPLPAESNIPHTLQHILWKSMIKEPNKRWSSASQMADALRGRRKVTTVKRQAILPAQSRRIPLSAFILLLIALIGVAAFALVLASRGAPEAERVEIVVTATSDPNQPTPAPNETLEPIVIVITATGEAAATPKPSQTVTKEAKRATEEAIKTATGEPTPEATQEPTLEATQEPTLEATQEPTLEATQEPTLEATQKPTLEATQKPTLEATQVPTQVPTRKPITNTPTLTPTTQARALAATEPPLPTNTPIPTLPAATSTAMPTVPPATATLPPATATLPPATATLPPPTATLPPATATLPPATATLPPATATEVPLPTNTPLPPTVKPLPTEPPPPTKTPIPEHPGYNNTSPLPTEPINGKIMREDTIQFFWEWHGVELASGHKFAIYAVRDNLDWVLAGTADGSARSTWASMSAVGGGQFETDWRWYMVILDRNNSPIEGTRSAEYKFGLTLP